MNAPLEAREYYNLKDDAKFREVILAIRADEACHRETNHHFADINAWENVESHLVNMRHEREESAEFVYGELPDKTHNEAFEQVPRKE